MLAAAACVRVPYAGKTAIRAMEWICCVPLILGEQNWWNNLGWDDAGLKSNSVPFFRELPPGFKGSNMEVWEAMFQALP
jgi:hypothetical protein